MATSRQTAAGVTVPDAKLAREATKLVREPAADPHVVHRHGAIPGMIPERGRGGFISAFFVACYAGLIIPVVAAGWPPSSSATSRPCSHCPSCSPPCAYSPSPASGTPDSPDPADRAEALRSQADRGVTG